MSLAWWQARPAASDQLVVTIISMINRTSLHSALREAPGGHLQESQEFLEQQDPWRHKIRNSGQLGFRL